MNNQQIAIYALIALVALGIGYGASSIFLPQQNGNATLLENSTNLSVAQPDMAQINALKVALEGLIQLQSGTATTLTYVGMEDMGNFVNVNFKDQNGAAMPPISVSRDFQYLYQGATKITDFATQVQLAQEEEQQASQPAQVPKSDKPVLEVFVMSYCPYGIQAEQAVIPVQTLLKGKVDFKIRFVDYAMHPSSGEVQENLRQYCMQKEQEDAYWKYLSCFVSSKDSASCLATAGVDKTKLDVCYNTTDQQYNLTNMLNDKSTWLSGAYPPFPLESNLNDQYGVGGSPTFVLNGVQSQIGRTPEGVKAAVCDAFNTPPAECSTTLSTSGTTASGSCG
ncbi:MAG: hypothetical protein WC488_02785 [Candidatus Micrarchaeia archaeon]